MSLSEEVCVEVGVELRCNLQELEELVEVGRLPSFELLF